MVPNPVWAFSRPRILPPFERRLDERLEREDLRVRERVVAVADPADARALDGRGGVGQGACGAVAEAVTVGAGPVVAGRVGHRELAELVEPPVRRRRVRHDRARERARARRRRRVTRVRLLRRERRTEGRAGRVERRDLGRREGRVVHAQLVDAALPEVALDVRLAVVVRAEDRVVAGQVHVAGPQEPGPGHDGLGDVQGPDHRAVHVQRDVRRAVEDGRGLVPLAVVVAAVAPHEAHAGVAGVAAADAEDEPAVVLHEQRPVVPEPDARLGVGEAHDRPAPLGGGVEPHRVGEGGGRRDRGGRRDVAVDAVGLDGVVAEHGTGLAGGHAADDVAGLTVPGGVGQRRAAVVEAPVRGGRAGVADRGRVVRRVLPARGDREARRAEPGGRRPVARGHPVGVRGARSPAGVLEPVAGARPRPRLTGLARDRGGPVVAVEVDRDHAVVVVPDALGADLERAGGGGGDARRDRRLRRRVHAAGGEAGDALLGAPVHVAEVTTGVDVGAVGRDDLRADGRAGPGGATVGGGAPVAEAAVREAVRLEAVPDEVVGVVRADVPAVLLRAVVVVRARYIQPLAIARPTEPPRQCML